MVYQMGHRRNPGGQLVVLTDDDFEALTPVQRDAWQGYTYKMTYETWNEEALEIGETDDKGWVEEGSQPYDSLQGVCRATREHSWLEWSDSNPGPRSWLIAEDEEDMRSGDRTTHNLWIERGDGKPLSDEEIDYINAQFHISSFGRMRRNPEGTWAFTEKARIWVPEVQFDQHNLPPRATIEPLRGYGHTWAVMQDGKCVGWIVVGEKLARELNAGKQRRNPEKKLNSFTRGYLEAALFSTTDESREDGGDPLDKNYSISDFAPEALERAKHDCDRFYDENLEDLREFDDAEAGADFWFTRNRHGVGFWDGDYPEPQATRLTDASKKFGEVWLTVGDDGLIYSS